MPCVCLNRNLRPLESRPSLPNSSLSESLPEIDGDPDLLHRAFQNLVLNAMDAMPAGGTLTLRTSERRTRSASKLWIPAKD